MSAPQNSSTSYNRRDFLKGGSLATLMTLLGGVELIAQDAAPPAASADSAGPKVKCGIIGLGVWGREIINTLLRLPNVDLAAICDTYPAWLKRAANLAPNAMTTPDYKTILADKDIAAVFVVTPTQSHKVIAIEALKAGKHVYCEAPLANTIEDARAIARAAKAAPKQLFQAGLQLRADNRYHYVYDNFIRTASLGKWVMTQGHWHKKQSWRFTSPNPEREMELNWRLDPAISTGLLGEIGIHQLDQSAWWLNGLPQSVTGFGTIALWDDGRTVPDTVQAVLEFPRGIRLTYNCTLASSFDAEGGVFFGSDASILMRENKAWMFKEADSALMGWEVYALKTVFNKDTGLGEDSGIALRADASKQTTHSGGPQSAREEKTPLHSALEAFIGNCAEFSLVVEDYNSTYDPKDNAAFAQYATEFFKPRPAATWREGLDATVIAIKANEAAVSGKRIEFKPEWFEVG